MTETIRIDEEQGYVDLKITGAWDAEELRSHIERVTEMAIEAGIHLVLADLTSMGELPPTTALYELKSALPQDFRHAIVAPVDELAAESVRFFETASMNIGVVVRVFPTRKIALDWLLS